MSELTMKTKLFPHSFPSITKNLVFAVIQNILTKRWMALTRNISNPVQMEFK